jgi:hypothetical protein
MKRQQQLWTLWVFTIGAIALLISLIHLEPTIHGVPLRVAELRSPLAALQPAELTPLRFWLGLDFAFMVVYTIVFTGWMRTLAGDSATRLAIVGRTLSWFVAFAVVFDAVENLILWVAADIGAARVSPWLPALVKLKWLSAVVFFGYLALWLMSRHVLPRLRAFKTKEASA